ncbi:F-box protein [Spatholobus suberectus]|nr:F-box protein [Spatholobus suberectus]
MEMSHASVFPQEVMVDILSWLPVKALMRFRCVSKTWKSLISDPTFVKLHLERSSKNTHILLAFAKDMGPEAEKRVIGACAPCSVRGLLENPLSTIHDCLHSFDFVFGSCNGLVCWLDYRGQYGFEEYWVIFWNPATRKMYEYSPCLPMTSKLSYSASTFKRQRSFASSKPNLILKASAVLAVIALFIFYVADTNIDPDLSQNMAKMPISWSLISATFSLKDSP